MKPTTVAPNNFGLTMYGCWDSDGPSKPLEEQFRDEGRQVEKIALPNIVGMAGSAYLLCFVSRKNEPSTVLVVPDSGGDVWGEDYYYFMGLSREQATSDLDAWLIRYDHCRAVKDSVVRSLLRPRTRHKRFTWCDLGMPTITPIARRQSRPGPSSPD